MNDPNQNYQNQNQNQNQNINPNQSLDYDQWVNSLGNIQDGIFQNTPMSNSILQNTLNNNANSSNFGTSAQELNLDLFFNSPERFYRDVINESPIVSKTPQVGRTPLKNLNINFSTPNFLKNIETSNIQSNSSNKNFTPLKTQLFNSKVEIFETPKLTKQNTTTLNSSPTTIKIGSSAMKNDENSNLNGSIITNKMIPPSPTPTSKITNNNNVVVHRPPVIAAPAPVPSIPKMGCFKKATEPENQFVKKSNNSNNSNSRFQIIMTDVNTFTNNSKNSKPKKKKLARSSTSINSSSHSISKKNTSLKRSLSQPQAKFMKSLTPNKAIDKKPEDESIISQSNSNSEVSSILTPKSSENSVQDLFDEDKILSDTEKLLNNRYF